MNILILVAKGLSYPLSKVDLMQRFLILVCGIAVLHCAVTFAAEKPEGEATAEQIAEARQLAADLGVVLKEDKDGHVILLDTAAKRSWVDDLQMRAMLVFPKLQSLTVEGPSISDQLAPRIAEQASLTSLAMRNTLISDKGIEQFPALKLLKIIDLRLSPLLTDRSAVVLATMPSLRAVRVSGVNFTDEGVKHLLGLPQLTELDLRNCRKVTKDGIAATADKKSLRVLKIGGGTINDEILAVVAGMGNLTSLSLDNCDISDQGVEQLHTLGLTDLTIYQAASVTDQGLSSLRYFDGLRSLTLRDIPATCAALALLPNPDEMRTLNVAQSAITDEQVKFLQAMIRLERLILNETNVTDACIDDLAKLKNLKYLEATQTQLSPEGVAKLRSVLPECKIRVN